jgi:hypothetical protein
MSYVYNVVDSYFNSTVPSGGVSMGWCQREEPRWGGLAAARQVEEVVE